MGGNRQDGGDQWAGGQGMSKIEFVNKGLPNGPEELGAHLEEIRRNVLAGGKATDEALERVAADVKVAHEAVKEAEKANAKVAELEQSVRDLHEKARTGGDDTVAKQLRSLPRLHKVEKDEDMRNRMDPAIFNILNLSRSELKLYLSGEALEAAYRFRRLNDQALMAHQLISLVTNGDPTRREDYARKGGVKGTELWEPLQEAAKPFMRAISTSTSGSVSEWIPNGYSSNLWEDVRDTLEIAGQFDFLPMPQNPYILPTWLGAMTAYVIPEATSNTVGSNTQFTASDFTVSNRTLTAKKVATLSWFSPESEQDSIIALLPQFGTEVRYAQAYGIETGVVNGQSTATIDTGSDPGTTDPRDNFDGLRYNASLVGSTTDFAGSLTAEKLAAMIELGGKYAKPGDCFFGTGYKGLARALILKDGNGNLVYTTVEKAGAAATLFTGVVGILMGHPLVVSGAYPQNLNASGVIDGVTTTKTGFIFANRRMFVGGNRAGLEIESSNGERFSYDQMAIRSKQRVAFRSLTAASSARPFVVAGVNL